MSGLIGFIIGAGLGVASTIVVKGKDNASQTTALNQQLNEILAENEKLRRRYKEVERHNEDLEAELEKLQRQAKNTSSNVEYLEDDLDSALRKVKKLTAENTELRDKIEEYKVALAAAEKK